MRATRVLIVDDNASFRLRLKEFLATERDIRIVGEALDGEDAVIKTREFRPDIVIMDVRMPGITGIQTTRRIKEEMPEVKVIMLSLLDVDEYRKAALASGANAYVLKKHLMEELLPAIRQRS
jgi:DNA-binding NarL/FixJ family response regulator